MKPFNLEEALKGAPVRLRNGCKAYVLANLKDLFPSENDFPLIGVHSSVGNCDVYYDSQSWTLTGFVDYYEDENAFDIVSMWEKSEPTQEQILEKAYNEDLKVTFDTQVHQDGYDVVGKLKSGGYLLQHGIVLVKSTNLTGIELYQEKPSTSTVTVTLPRPFKPKEGDRYWRITTNILGKPCVRDTEALSNKEARYGFKTSEDAQAWLDAMKEAVDE